MAKTITFRVINGRAQFKCPFCQKKRNVAIPPTVRKRSIRCHQCDEMIRCNFNRREIWVEEKLVKLRPTEYRLLYHLVQNAGWVNTHEQLLSKVWGFEYQDEPHYVRLYVNYLRKKIEQDPSNPKYILTERGVGYRFVNYRRNQEAGE